MSEKNSQKEELEVGDKIKIEGHMDVTGLKDGCTYKVEAVENFKENVILYVLRNEDLDLQLKARKDKLDRVLGREHRVKVEDPESVEAFKKLILTGF